MEIFAEAPVPTCGLNQRQRCAGFSMLDVAVSLILVSALVLGAVATLSGAFMSERLANGRLASQLLLNRVMEESRSVPYSTLLSLNGQFVLEGEHRADISVDLVDLNLTRVQVDVTSSSYPEVESRGVLLRAARD
jgi:Tfp pilus assembly protein PilV